MKILQGVKSIVLLVACTIFYPTISNSQNIGIGTTTPAHKLSVNGNANINGNLFVNTIVKEYDERLTIHTGSDSFGLIHSNGKYKLGTWVGDFGGASGGWIGNLSRHDLYFFTDNSGALVTIDTLGSMSIGVVSPNKSSMLDITSTSKGVLLPRMSAAQRNNIVNPAKGLIVFVNDDSSFYYRQGVTWKKLNGEGDDWSLSGNAGTTNKKLGTTDNVALRIYTNNSEKLTVDPAGNVGIGNTTPAVKLDVVNDLRVLGSKASFTITNSNAAVNGAVVVGQLTGISNPPQFRFRSASGNNTDIGLDVNNFFVIEANEAPSFTMHPAGYFGIGFNVYGSPLQRLFVRGDQEDAVVIENNNPAFRALYVKGTTVINGILVKPGGSFKIDHPLDPENKYLSHSFVESPDMMNVYNGNIVTDKNGNATITMPDWFEALNRDFRYQLTVLGQFAQAIVSEKMKGNVFSIKTDKPNVEVSWQVTGIRHDAWANKNRIPVEENKTTKEKGKYLSPESFGKPASLSVR